MKATRGNGTPYPKVRRFSDEEHSQSHGIQHDEPCQAIRNQTRSSLQKLLDVHTQVTQTLHQIDSTVLNIHTLASSNHVADAEVQVFADALANIDANLQDLNIFLRAAAERSSSLLRNLDQEPSTTGSHESTPPGGSKCSSVSPLITDLEFGAISYSPLVATDLLDCESPNGSETLTCSPPRDWTGGTRRSTSISPLPQTPCMQSPPRSTRILSTINESPSPLVAFTTDSDGQVTPRTEDLWTPPCQSRLGFETSLAQVTNGDDGLFSLQTPGFGVSPPRTCDPGETVHTESDDVTPTPVMHSPFRTPGILLEFSTDSRESSSAVSPAISDDLTISAVKRLGPRGLEERLWQELAIRNADVLQFAKSRQGCISRLDS